ncbi:MAG: hypothetical protein MUE34_17735 [Acidimicrobiales bacterium]|jgi:hypothetical protein|nr:hypothetical protein [Acidimicrobiales bacterium]
MSEDSMTDDCPEPAIPTLDTHQNGQGTPVASLDAITTLIHSFASMISNTEKRITDQINSNAAASKERWGKWEQEFKDYREANDERIGKVEGRVTVIEEAEKHDKTVWDARVGPLRNAATILARSWRTLIVVGFAILGFLGLATNIAQDVIEALP